MSAVRQYRKKPVVVEAIQWDPSDPGGTGRVVGWLQAHGYDFNHPAGLGESTLLVISTPSSEVCVYSGWWIVRHPNGSVHATGADSFAAIYEPAEL